MNEKLEFNQDVAEERRLVISLAGLGDGDEIAVNDVGWDSRVYVVNGGQFVFKFPRSEKVKSQYSLEIAAYRLMEGLDVPVEVPRVMWEHPANGYFGYAGVVGIALDQVASVLSNEEKRMIGERIGFFLGKLHGLRLEGAPHVTVDEEISEFQSKYEIARPAIWDRFKPAEQSRLESVILDELPKALRSIGSDPVLCHGDLGYWNLVYRKGHGVGVIDFGDVGYYDGSKDFIGLDEGVSLEAALQAYGDGAKLRERIALRRKILPLLDLPYYLGKQNEAGIKSAISRIRQYL
ncbi:hypothetical protein IAD21_01968 [Abditibacteriota bacterium]|nr:hypothetical protein IAD21_01968 [Abditibacteriota bacterium]